MVIGQVDCGGGPVDGSDWMRVRGAVDLSPGGVRIGYIRRALCERCRASDWVTCLLCAVRLP